MATTLFLEPLYGATGDNTLVNGLTLDNDRLLRPSKRWDGGVAASQATSAGPVNIQFLEAGSIVSYWTRPLHAVTISGAITVNLWMAESSTMANVGAGIQIAAYGVTSNYSNFIGFIATAGKGTELPTARSA